MGEGTSNVTFLYMDEEDELLLPPGLSKIVGLITLLIGLLKGGIYFLEAGLAAYVFFKIVLVGLTC